MRTVRAAGIIAVLLLPGMNGSTAVAAKPHPRTVCFSGHHTLLAADGHGALYEVAARRSPSVYGCAFGERHSYRFGPVVYRYSTKYMEEGFFGISREVLAGGFAAYEELANSLGCGFCHWTVIVRNLRTGRSVRREPTGTPVNPALQENHGVGPTTAIVLKSDGAVAWIADARAAEGRPSEGGYQVHAADRYGSRLLATGEDVDPGSLALAGSTIYWTEGGRPFSAPLE